MIHLIPVITGLAFRFRGGGFFPLGSTFAARSAYSTIMGIITALAFQDYWLLASIPLWFAGCVMGHAEWMDLGRVRGKWFKDFVFLTGRGLIYTLPVGVLLGFMVSIKAGLIVGLAGLAQGIVYEISFHIPSKIKYLNKGPELGEFLYGIILGVGISLGVLIK